MFRSQQHTCIFAMPSLPRPATGETLHVLPKDTLAPISISCCISLCSIVYYATWIHPYGLVEATCRGSFRCKMWPGLFRQRWEAHVRTSEINIGDHGIFVVLSRWSWNVSVLMSSPESVIWWPLQDCCDIVAGQFPLLEEDLV